MERKELSRMPITVGHIVYAFKNGGIERGILNIVNYGDRNHFRHVIICLTEAGEFAKLLDCKNCKVVELHKADGNDFRVPARICAVARQNRIDILHARGWPAMVETALAARMAGVRATIYGFHGRGISELKGLTLRRRWAQRLLIRCFHQIITLNTRMQSELAIECGISKDVIQIVANGVDIKRFRPLKDRDVLRSKLGLPVDRFVIGNVARLDPVKNHELLLKVLTEIRANGGDPFLVLVGDGPHRPALEQEINRLKVGSDVSLYGYSDLIPELINCMDIFVQSSFYEGFSNTVLEAMSCGIPILATDVGGTRDVLNEGQEGHLFNPNDPKRLASLLVELIKDPERRQILGDRARRRVVEYFPVEAMVRKYEEIYFKLAAHCKNSRTACEI